MVDTNVQRAVFDPIERAILSDYFGIFREEDIEGLDIAPSDEDHERDPSSGDLRIRLRLDMYGRTSAHTLENAVARLALSSIRWKLPQFHGMTADGTNLFARDLEPPLRRDVQLKPVHLFTINWATTGPCYSWPVAYYVTWIPGFDRFVVTSSADSPDVFGYTDVALGWFPGSTPVLKGSGSVIFGFWLSIAHNHQKWEEFLEPGLVTKAQANAWAREVDFLPEY